MTTSNRRTLCRRLACESGTTLIETAIACAILLVVMAGLMGLTSMASSLTENEGHLGARTTEYAVDKMEQLLQLAYADSQSDTTQFPALNSGGTGLTNGGSSNTSTPVVGYADYLDQQGNPKCPCASGAPSDWYYMRAWQISAPTGTTNLKQITVTASVRTSVARAKIATATVTAYKSNCPNGC
jgi:hypothetical protein